MTYRGLMYRMFVMYSQFLSVRIEQQLTVKEVEK